MPSIRVQGLSRRGFRVNQNQRVNYNKSTVVDLEDYPDARILSAHQGDYYTVPELDIELPIEGALSTSSIIHFVVPRDSRLISVTGTVSTPPAGDDSLVVEVHKVDAGGEVTATGTEITSAFSPALTMLGARNEVQTLDATGTVSGGTYTLTFDGETTAAIDYNADAATIVAALNALSNVASGDIVVAGDTMPAAPVTLSFAQAYAKTDVPLITVDSDSLTGGGTYDVVETTSGRPDSTSFTSYPIDNYELEAGDVLRFEVVEVGEDTAGSNLRLLVTLG